MKVNARIYNSITLEPFEIQEIDGHHVELFYLNDFPGILAENTAKGRFAVWSSADGNNYRLLVEKGYYETVTKLYEKPVNKIWLEFWGDCEGISKKMYRFFLVPASLIALIGFGVTVAFLQDAEYAQTRNIISAVILVLFILAMLLFRKVSSNEINKANANSVTKIKKTIGSQTFENLLKEQRNYMDEYFRQINEENVDLEEEEVSKLSDNRDVIDDLNNTTSTDIENDVFEADLDEEIDKKAEENRKDL